MAKIQQEQEDTLRKTVERDEQINKLKADLNTSAHLQATLKKDHESKMAEQTLRIAKQESEIGKLSAELKATNATNQDPRALKPEKQESLPDLNCGDIQLGT